tara:strand:- start:83 stop:295 length:213 start_codon:yes stop_codon:yes gene_type:complete
LFIEVKGALNLKMSTEKFIDTDKNIPHVPVDINHLLARVRKEQQKASKVNLIFFFLFAALILISGILLSF